MGLGKGEKTDRVIVISLRQGGLFACNRLFSSGLLTKAASSILFCEWEALTPCTIGKEGRKKALAMTFRIIYDGRLSVNHPRTSGI